MERNKFKTYKFKKDSFVLVESLKTSAVYNIRLVANTELTIGGYAYVNNHEDEVRVLARGNYSQIQDFVIASLTNYSFDDLFDNIKPITKPRYKYAIIEFPGYIRYEDGQYIKTKNFLCALDQLRYEDYDIGDIVLTSRNDVLSDEVSMARIVDLVNEDQPDVYYFAGRVRKLLTNKK